MRPGAIVVLEPAGEDRRALRGGVVRPDVGPFAQGRLDEALGFAVRAGCVRPGALVPDMQGATGRAKAAGDVARSIVRQHAPDLDAVGAEPLQGPTEKAGHRQASFVGQQLDIGDPGMVIDRDMQTLPANALVDIHVPRAARDAVADPGDPPELLRVEVQQIAGARVLVAVHQRRRFQPPAPGQARATRAAVAALTPTAPAICAHVHRWWRSTLIPSWMAGAVAWGLAWGRLERSCNPVTPSAR